MSRQTIIATPSKKVYAALGVLYFAWGSTYVAFKVTFERLPPLLTTGTRFALAGLVLLGIGRWGGARFDRITWPQVRSALILGFLMVGLGAGLVVIAVNHLTTGTTALVQASVPMWVALGDRAVFGTRLGRRSIAGLLVGFVGILVLGGTGSGSAGLIWIVSVLLGSVGFAAGALASRALPLVEGRIVATGLQMLLGGLMVAVAGIIHGDLDTVHFHTLQSSSLLAWLYLLFVSALLGFTLYMWLLGSAPATLVATASYVDPVMALVFGWALLGEGLTARAAVAATIIVAGAVLIVSSPTNHQPASEDEVGK